MQIVEINIKRLLMSKIFSAVCALLAEAAKKKNKKQKQIDWPSSMKFRKKFSTLKHIGDWIR